MFEYSRHTRAKEPSFLRRVILLHLGIKQRPRTSIPNNHVHRWFTLFLLKSDRINQLSSSRRHVVCRTSPFSPSASSVLTFELDAFTAPAKQYCTLLAPTPEHYIMANVLCCVPRYAFVQPASALLLSLVCLTDMTERSERNPFLRPLPLLHIYTHRWQSSVTSLR